MRAVIAGLFVLLGLTLVLPLLEHLRLRREARAVAFEALNQDCSQGDPVPLPGRIRAWAEWIEDDLEAGLQGPSAPDLARARDWAQRMFAAREPVLRPGATGLTPDQLAIAGSVDQAGFVAEVVARYRRGYIHRAAHALAVIGSPRAVDALQRTARGRDPEAAAAAQGALRQLRGGIP